MRAVSSHAVGNGWGPRVVVSSVERGCCNTSSPFPRAAARAFALHLSTPRPPGPGGPLTGVDYLAVIAERHRRYVHRGLRLADPSGALAALRGWQLINLITGGRLLTSGPAG